MSEQKLTIEDILGESNQYYLSEEEAKLIRSTFHKNPRLLRAVQKVFLPNIFDDEMPPEQIVAQDPWLTGKQWDIIPADEAKILVVARQDFIKWVANGLTRLKAIANQSDESIEEMSRRNAKNSTK